MIHGSAVGRAFSWVYSLITKIPLNFFYFNITTRIGDFRKGRNRLVDEVGEVFSPRYIL